MFKRGRKEYLKNGISKPSWTLRGGSLLGGVLFSQRKSIWNRGRQFQILKMLCKLVFMYLWLFAKDLWNGFTKRICKNKTSGANVVQNVKYIKTTIYAYKYFHFKVTYAHLSKCKLVTFLHFVFALVCVGINHQKWGDWKGNGPNISYNRFWCLTSITNHMD